MTTNNNNDDDKKYDLTAVVARLKRLDPAYRFECLRKQAEAEEEQQRKERQAKWLRRMLALATRKPVDPNDVEPETTTEEEPEFIRALRECWI